ncbi:MAG: CZB domain-containing protein [Holosporales bacterium]
MPAHSTKKRVPALPPCKVAALPNPAAQASQSGKLTSRSSPPDLEVSMMTDHMNFKMQLIQHINGVQAFDVRCHPAKMCPLSHWLKQFEGCDFGPHCAELQKLHDLFHATTDVVLGFAESGRKEMAARYVAPGGDFTVISDNFNRALEKFAMQKGAARRASLRPAGRKRGR